MRLRGTPFLRLAGTGIHLHLLTMQLMIAFDELGYEVMATVNMNTAAKTESSGSELCCRRWGLTASRRVVLRLQNAYLIWCSNCLQATSALCRLCNAEWFITDTTLHR